MRHRYERSGCERAQSTVELALVLPAVLLLVLVVLQGVLLARDRLAVVHVARAAARTAVVEPTPDAVRAAAHDAGGGLRRLQVDLGGDRRPGGLVTVEVTAEVPEVPLLAAALPTLEVRESFSARVEG